MRTTQAPKATTPFAKASYFVFFVGVIVMAVSIYSMTALFFAGLAVALVGLALRALAGVPWRPGQKMRGPTGA
jgi:hypothetical protein